MSRLKHIVNAIVWITITAYFALIAVIHVPIVQSWLGSKVSGALASKLSTRVMVARVDLGFLNRLVIDGVTVYDQSGKRMLSASRVAAKIDYYELLRNGRIFISSAQLFGVNGVFYQSNATTKPNYQFVLDSLASKDKTKPSTIELSINSLIVRHGAFTFDRNDIAPTRGRFNVAHLGVKDISAHFVIPYFRSDSLVAEVKKLALNEHSGLSLRDLTFKLSAGKSGLHLSGLELKLPHSALRMGELRAKYRIHNGTLNKETLHYTGRIDNSKVTLADVAPILPAFKSANIPISISIAFSGDYDALAVEQLHLQSADNAFALKANGYLAQLSNPRWRATIKELRCTADFVESMFGGDSGVLTIPDVINRLGSVSYKGTLTGHSGSLAAIGTLVTDVGTANIDIDKKGNTVTASINSGGIDIRKLTQNECFGLITANVKGSAVLANSGVMPSVINLNGTVNRFDYNGYSYKNIAVNGQYSRDTFSGTASLNDPNGTAQLEGRVNTNAKNPNIDLTAHIRKFDPAALKLTDRWRGSKLDMDLTAQLNLTNKTNPLGNVMVSGFALTSAEDVFRIDNINMVAQQNHLLVTGDFGHIDLNGCYDLRSLSASVLSQLHTKLPTLFTNKQKVNNNYIVDAEINSLEVINRLFNIPIRLNAPLKLNAAINDDTHQLALGCTAKNISYNGEQYRNILIKANSPTDTLYAQVSADKVMDNGHSLSVNLDMAAAADRLLTTVKWNNHLRHPFVGTLNMETAFTTGKSGTPDIHTTVQPSDVMVSDSVWHILPAEIKYSGGDLSVSNFAIEHNRQHIRVNGMATRSSSDSILVDLQDVDVSYILNLVNFHSVDFSGRATGTACVKSVFFTPDAYANLLIRDFRFEHGLMGDLKAFASWNKTEKRIDIKARAEEASGAETVINGFVSPVNNNIDLAIEARQTNLEFMESFCGSFLGNVAAQGKGLVRLVGPLNKINLVGTIVADGSVYIKPLNVTYTLDNDTVRFVPDNIIFASDTVRDRNGNIGIVNGQLHHQHLTHLTYNLQINAKHFLCYDTHSYGDDVFYGTAYGTGQCNIQGGNGRIDIDVDIKPEKNSFIEYNAASPETISSQEYITWHDATQTAPPYSVDSLSVDSVVSSQLADVDDETQDNSFSIPSDLRINFTLDVTPDATLRVLMDRASGDYIALNGSGSIRATYFNKGTFDIFGNYLIDHGLYKLTIQNVIKKEFQFQSGSTIVFGGDPLSAALNLKALYTINGVPLSDLRLGRSFSSNNVRVDCMMNISGTPESPKVDFDLDLPTVNSDAKQMVKTIINGEEEMNQQVVYLLSVGRFYIQNNNDATHENTQQSQTSLAMQSLLSGTISQQINSLLGSIVKNNNWSFGANISTGDEGFNNAEYEGLLQGRLLNNRLIINGQFGYRDNANATTSFIGDFDINYLLFPSGNLAIKVYNQTNDRYFTKSSLNTQGIGLMMKKDFNSLRDLFGIKRKSLNAVNEKH